MAEKLKTPLQVFLGRRDIGPFLRENSYCPTEQLEMQEKLPKAIKLEQLRDVFLSLEACFARLDTLKNRLAELERSMGQWTKEEFRERKMDLWKMIARQDDTIDPLLAQVKRRYDIWAQEQSIFDARDLQRTVQMAFAA